MPKPTPATFSNYLACGDESGTATDENRTRNKNAALSNWSLLQLVHGLIRVTIPTNNWNALLSSHLCRHQV